jgi:F0F1-type ATP synthase membrane subunit b/b'
MVALFTSILLLAAEGRFTRFYNEWFNIPGFELWKFINLFLFIAIMVYLVKKPLSDAFKAKRDLIRAELIKAEEEKQAALARLTTAEAKIAQLETEKQHILTRANEEAMAEKQRIEEQTQNDVSRLQQQTDAELARLMTQTRAELKRFSAEESVRLAEAKLRAMVDGNADSRLIKASISEIGGLN